MKLWILSPAEDPPNKVFNDYDTAQGFIIVADTEDQARQIAQENGADETRTWKGKQMETINTWLNPTMTSCIELVDIQGAPRIIMEDFRAG